MKTLIKLTACTALLAATSMGQRPFGVLTNGSAPDPATIVANKVARLTSLLTLTSAE